MNILPLIGRTQPLISDLYKYESSLSELVSKSKFLVLGGAGSIGQAVVKELFKRNPVKLHIVDISENNLVELVRDIRSSTGYMEGDFKTFALDVGSIEFARYFNQEGPFDYVLNLSALKHVRSEKDSYTLMRMIDVNIINTIKSCFYLMISKARLSIIFLLCSDALILMVLLDLKAGNSP